MKVLLIGKTGQLGGDILRNGGNLDIYAPGREVLDIRSREAIQREINNFRPSVVINTAAFHNVPQCETNFEAAFRTNCISVRDLALECHKAGTLFVTFSTDYVFNGSKKSPYTEDDAPAPLQIYGITRIAGEYAAMSAAPDNHVIIRTCGLFGLSGAQSKGGNFVYKRIQDAKTCKTLEMGCDQVVSPTYTDDLSRAVLKLIQHPQLKPGIYHLVNEGECTWYEFARSIYEIMGMIIEVRPVDRGGLDGEMRRPLYSVLANTKAKKLGIELPHWRDGLERYLHSKYLSKRFA